MRKVLIQTTGLNMEPCCASCNETVHNSFYRAKCLCLFHHKCRILLNHSKGLGYCPVHSVKDPIEKQVIKIKERTIRCVKPIAPAGPIVVKPDGSGQINTKQDDVKMQEPDPTPPSSVWEEPYDFNDILPLTPLSPLNNSMDSEYLPKLSDDDDNIDELDPIIDNKPKPKKKKCKKGERTVKMRIKFCDKELSKQKYEVFMLFIFFIIFRFQTICCIYISIYI